MSRKSGVSNVIDRIRSVRGVSNDMSTFFFFNLHFNFDRNKRVRKNLETLIDSLCKQSNRGGEFS